MTTEVGLIAAAMRDNMKTGLYTCFEWDNEAWNEGTNVWFWDQVMNSLFPDNPGGEDVNVFWGYMAAHCSRIIYDTYGAGNRSKWKGMLTMFPFANTVPAQIIGINFYIADNPTGKSGGPYTITDLFDEVVPNTYYGAQTFLPNSINFAPQVIGVHPVVSSPFVFYSFWTAFGAVKVNAPVKFSTTGSLPAPLSADVLGSAGGNIYYVSSVGTPNEVVSFSGSPGNCLVTMGSLVAPPNDSPVNFFSNGGTLPTGITDSSGQDPSTTFYYVINSTNTVGGTFNVASTPGGSAITISANGSGSPKIGSNTIEISATSGGAVLNCSKRFDVGHHTVSNCPQDIVLGWSCG